MRPSTVMVARPILVVLARAESGSRYEAVVVSPEQMIVILNELDSPETRLEWTLALVHASTALRPEEAFGLKWRDIDWLNGQIKICRGWSKGKETPGKTEGSMTQVAMHPALAQALRRGARNRVYSRDDDWVFASDRSKGKTPRSAGVAGQDYLRPAAVKAGAIPEGYEGRFGWHNLRHSLATFFAANEVNLAGHPEHLAPFKTFNDCFVHAPGQCRTDGGTSEVPRSNQDNFGCCLGYLGWILGWKSERWQLRIR